MSPDEFFPNMPQEVRKMWLKPFIAIYGWPFDRLDQSTEGTRWFFTLARKSLQEWSDATWERRVMAITPDELNEFGFDLIKQIAVSGTSAEADDSFAPGAVTIGGNDRFRAAARFIEEKGQIPLSIILIWEGDRFGVLDGSHRLAALWHLGLLGKLAIPVWIVHHRDHSTIIS